MNKKYVVGLIGITAISLIFLTPAIPFDEAIAGIVAIIVAMMK